MFKYRAKDGWAKIFGRIVSGYLEENLDYHDYDIIVPNPNVSTGRQHTEMVIDAARKLDVFGFWKFDRAPWALTKTRVTPRSAGGTLDDKVHAAKMHAQAITVDRKRIRGAKVLVYDDVFTTGNQLDQVGRLLMDNGAESVDGLVLARAPWRM